MKICFLTSQVIPSGGNGWRCHLESGAHRDGRCELVWHVQLPTTNGIVPQWHDRVEESLRCVQFSLVVRKLLRRDSCHRLYRFAVVRWTGMLVSALDGGWRHSPRRKGEGKSKTCQLWTIHFMDKAVHSRTKTDWLTRVLDISSFVFWSVDA